MKLFFKILTLLVSTTLSAQMSVAVLDFDGIGISKDEAKALSGRFGTEFMGVSKGVYNIVERNQMGKILEEQGFQNTGIVSSDDAVKMGEALKLILLFQDLFQKLGTLLA
jgi:hypothetical protein